MFPDLLVHLLHTGFVGGKQFFFTLCIGREEDREELVSAGPEDPALLTEAFFYNGSTVSDEFITGTVPVVVIDPL